MKKPKRVNTSCILVDALKSDGFQVSFNYYALGRSLSEIFTQTIL